MTKTIRKGETDPATSADNSIADPNATVVLTGGKWARLLAGGRAGRHCGAVRIKRRPQAKNRLMSPDKPNTRIENTAPCR